MIIVRECALDWSVAMLLPDRRFHFYFRVTFNVVYQSKQWLEVAEVAAAVKRDAACKGLGVYICSEV